MNGEKIDNSILNDKTIKTKTLTIYSGNNKNMIAKYGEQAKNGVFIFEDAVIIDKPDFVKNFVPNMDSVRNNDKIFTKTEIEPSFPGGKTAWIKFITDTIKVHISELINEGKAGTCHVKFIVEPDGKVSDVEAIDLRGTKLAEVCINAIKTGPNWIPAKQNEHIVAAYKIQPITFTMQEVK